MPIPDTPADGGLHPCQFCSDYHGLWGTVSPLCDEWAAIAESVELMAAESVEEDEVELFLLALRADGIDAEGPHEVDDGRAEDGVTVEDQISRRGVVRKRLA